MDMPFIQGIEQIATVKILKYILTTTLVLIQLDYNEARLIILTIDRYNNK